MSDLQTGRRSAALMPLAALGLPLVLFVILQPETFGIAPNALDPLFYTGLGINADDALSIGSNHYFITRWSAWYPLYLADRVAGPFLGRLLLRWAMVAVVVFGLWALRSRWTWSQRLLAATVLITSPLFLRPLLTDYVEYAIVLYGLGLVLLALRREQTWITAGAAGILTALLLVANPFTVTMVAIPLFVQVMVQTRGVGRKVGFSVIIGLAVVAVVGAGLVWFRWRHGVADIYQPTLNFLRNPPGPDKLKSPRLEWLARFSWLWMPPVLAAVAGLSAWRRGRLDRTEILALAMAMGQYLIQWADQFVRDGNGLEISYYWSMSFPTLGVALALLVGRLAEGMEARWAAGLGAGWLILLVVGVPGWLRLPAGLGLAVVAAAVLGSVAWLLGRRPTAAAAVFLAFVIWAQIGAPPYDPLAYHFFNASPAYDRMFWGDGDEAEDLHREAVWFEREMERVPLDRDSAFFPLNDWASPIVGIYHPHVGGQLIGGSFDRRAQIQLVASNFSNLVLLGPPDQAAVAVEEAEAELNVGLPLLDVTHDRDLGYRLVVYELPSMPLPLTLEATDLAVRRGLRDGDDVVVKSASPDFVVYGPYLRLDPGRYQVTLRYASALPPSATAATFDLFTLESGAAATRPLSGTDGALTNLVVQLEVGPDAGKWEFRVFGAADGLLRIDQVTVRAA